MKAEYLMSAENADKLPRLKHQIAFVGRSNVGKSTLINAITSVKDLCRTSKTPGRTQKINYFKYRDYTFVDLPGYGFAKVPLEFRHKWDALMTGYFDNNEDLSKIFILVDARRGLMDSDRHMISLLQNYPYNIILTKCDKVNNAQYTKEAIQNELNVLTYMTSASNKLGIKEMQKLFV